MEHLIPGKWKWEVEDAGYSTFRTNFPFKGELQRMIEWGVVQSKFDNAKMVIGERGPRDQAKYVMPKIWVQFTGLPDELRDFLVIWVVGSILGITKDVDMMFTRAHEVTRMQVIVLDSGLIPVSVDVAIGDNVYELKFKVEAQGSEGNVIPMDMDKIEDNKDSTNQHNEKENRDKGYPNVKGHNIGWI
jgi:hypothetical protein